jgi:hypothetical protein
MNGLDFFHDVPNLSDPDRARNGEISPRQSSFDDLHMRTRDYQSPNTGPGSEADRASAVRKPCVTTQGYETRGEIRQDIAVKPDTSSRRQTGFRRPVWK